jgi:hypothetical protein
VAAEEDEYPAIGLSDSPLNDWSGVEAPGLDTTRLATLHSLLTGDSLQSALDRYEPVFVSPEEAETIVLRVDGEMFEELVELDDESMENVAVELAATESYDDEPQEPEDVQMFLSAFVDLAHLAESQGQRLFVWIKLLQE